MWTAENPKCDHRSRLRYPSDLTDDEWQFIEPLIPPAKRGGRRREVNVREVMNGVMYVLSTGCQWRAIPRTCRPEAQSSPTWIYGATHRTLERIHYELYVRCREQAEREASPTAAIIDSQSVKSAEKRGPRSTRMATMQERKSRVRNGIFL